MTISVSTSNFRMAKWIVSQTPGFGTHITIAAANAASAVGDTIFLRDGIYTEDVTILPGRTYTSLGGSEDTATCTVLGKWTMTAAGESTIKNINMRTNGDFFLSVSGSNICTVNVTNCNINCTNNTGISFTNSNASSIINIYECFGNISNPGIAYFAHSGAGEISFLYTHLVNGGGSTTSNTISSGIVSFDYSVMVLPTVSTSTSLVIAHYSTIYNGTNSIAFTIGGSGGAVIQNCLLNSGTQSCISVSSSLKISNCLLTSSNTNVITGAGSIEYDVIVFDGPSKTINVTTQTCTNSATFLPVLSFGGGSTGITYSDQLGRYYRSGNLVTFFVEISLTNKGSSTGAAVISGLPFASAISTTGNLDFVTTCLAVTAATATYFFSDLSNGQTSVGIFFGVAATGNFTQMDDTNFSNNSIVRIQGSYFV